jgi:hypothetical protein
MIRNLKVLGLAFAAVLSLGAVAVGSAQAASSLDVGASPAWITGTQSEQNKFTADGVTAKCNAASFEATTQTANVTELTVTPKYGEAVEAGKECQLAGTNAKVKMNGCQYTFTNTATALTAEVDITNCNTGKTIEIEETTATCVFTVKAQGPLSHVVFENEVTSPKTVVANATVTNIHFVEDGVNCPHNNMTGTTAQYTGKVTLKAFGDVGGVEQSTQVNLEAT